MKKNKGIRTLVIVALVLIGLAYTAVVGIGMERAGSASQIKQGLDEFKKLLTLVVEWREKK